jgi:hypothetical protein
MCDADSRFVLQIPNPLFDLAGITCGHFMVCTAESAGVSPGAVVMCVICCVLSQVPFWTFFGATFIGKAIFKVSLQVSAIPSIIPSSALCCLSVAH